MAIQPVPSMTAIPGFPALSERAAGTYNSSAYAFGNHMSVTFRGELLAVANNVKSNADEAYALAGEAANSATAAGAAATNAASALTDAQTARDQALAYAQAAGASAGVPAPPPGVVSYFQYPGSGSPIWGGAPVDANKLDKQGGVANKISYTYTDLGSIAASGMATLNANTATVFRVQALGALTLAFSNLPSGSVSGDLEVLCVNFGGKTITWPAGNWIKPDGSYASSPAAAGVTFQTSGADRVLVMIDNGSLSYKVMR